MPAQDSTETLSLNGLRVRCAVALTPAEHALGLQKHAKLDEDEGLLFLFPRVRTAQFWMGEVPFAIDLVGIDGQSRVSRIVEGAMPGSTERWSFSRVSAVLEVPAGTCRRAGLRGGDLITASDSRTAQVSADDATDIDGVHNSTNASDDGDAADEAHGPETGLNQPELKVGDRFKVGRYGPTWQVTKASGSAGFCQRVDHKRKWFGYSHNRDTGEVAVYPVVQGSGDRLGAPVAYGRFDLTEEPSTPEAPASEAPHDASADVAADFEKVGDGFNPWSPQDQQIDNRDTEHPDEQYRDRETPDALTQSSNGAHGMYDTPKEQYYHELYPDALADEALEPSVQDPVTRHGAIIEAPAQQRRIGQIVDEAKFVEKVARILFAHADEIPWEPDALNGGATERAVVGRQDLARWLGGSSSPNVNGGIAAAAPEATRYIIDAASNDRGLSLIGNAFVLADMADFSRIGFSGRRPILVLYREPREGESTSVV